MTAVLFLIAGLVALTVAGNLLVRGATAIASLARISPAVVGLTIVAAGTSMPELVVSLRAALGGSADVALGNVIGSNIFNIACILGIAAMISPLKIQGNAVRMEWPVMFMSSCLLLMLARDGQLDRLEGGFFLAGLVVFITYTVYIARRAVAPAEVVEFQQQAAEPIWGGSGQRAWGINIGATAVGAAGLALGADLFVEGAIDIARALDVSERIIGLTVVSIGTSLPELTASVIAARRGHDDIAIANILGSNIFNVLAIMGATAVVTPVTASPAMIDSDIWWMMGISLLLLPLMRSGMGITRVEGGVLFAAYATYTTLLILN